MYAKKIKSHEVWPEIPGKTLLNKLYSDTDSGVSTRLHNAILNHYGAMAWDRMAFQELYDEYPRPYDMLKMHNCGGGTIRELMGLMRKIVEVSGEPSLLQTIEQSPEKLLKAMFRARKLLEEKLNEVKKIKEQLAEKEQEANKARADFRILKQGFNFAITEPDE